MLRIFRRIRKNNLLAGKSRRYLKYAIGEIALVVIGILIALQINNWNENVKTLKSKKQSYLNIKRQLTENKEIVEACIKFNNKYIEQYLYAIEQIQSNNRSNLDSLAIISINLLEYSDYHKESNVYSLLVSSGETKLLKNQKVLTSLQRLEELYIYLNKMEVTHFDLIKLIYPELKEIVSFNPIKVEDVEAFFNYKFHNHFVIAVDISMEKDQIYRTVLKDIEFSLNLIDAELGFKTDHK